ncbi:hypothetical protein HK098_002227 [Nowakowskiella sp. JEL0407]|nr:hypothetical protein HK098_002227 [Nowakowskiella sp. JEL0407]
MQLDGTIKVAIRIRPLNRNESDHFSAWKVHGTNTIVPCTVDGRPSQYTSPFCFDSIFDESAKTTEIYSQIAKEIVEGSMDGINGTIFAYGQTSSGKTHTMQGNASEPGIIPQAITHIFQHIIDSPEREFLLRVSYLEIYNENIRDLLAPEKDNLKVNEDITRGIFVKNLTEEIVSSPQEVAKLMIKGDRNRHVGETNMNERSSRSHTIFRMDIESRDREEGKKGRSSIGGAVKISSLNLVDLAGSERVGHTGAEGIRLKEGGHINKSLLTLGTVIKKLSENGGHIPYRDSRLTRILQPSLGGNARTAIICTITPSNVFMDETVGTLKFASRAKTIKNKPEVNETISDEALLKQYKKEIRDLKEQLDVVKARESQTDLSRTSVSSVNKETDQNAIREKLEHMMNMILTGSKLSDTPSVAKKHKVVRRQTWFPGSNAAAYQDDSDDDEGDRNIVSAEIRRPLKRKQNSENIAEDVAGNMETIPITSNPDQNTVAVPTNPDPDPDEIAPLFPPIKYGLNRADCEKMDLLEKLVLKTLCERQEKECEKASCCFHSQFRFNNIFFLEKMAFELAKYKSGMSTTSSQNSPLKTPNRTIKRMRSVSDELDQSPNKQIHLEQVDNESPEVSSNQDTQLRDELSATNSKCEELERKLALQEESAQLKSRSDAEELNSLKEQIREFLSQNANLRDELNASKLQSDELKQKLTIQEETVQMRSRTYVEELNSLKDENKRVHDQNAQLRDELSAVKSLSEELDQKFTLQEEFVRSAAEEVHSLKDQNIKIHDHNAQLRDELSAAKLRSDELEQKLASQEESAQLRLRSDAEALNSLKYQNKELHEQIAQLRDELRASRERSEELERNLSSESVELDSLKIQNNEIHDQNKRLRDELIATKLSQEELKQMLAMQEESALIKSRSDADVLNSMRDELDTAKSKCDELERKLTMQVESSETELRSAAEELNSLKQQNEENMEQNALLRDELEGSKSTCEELERKLRTQEENFEVRSRAEAEEYGTLTKQSDELKNRNVALVDIASVLFSSPDVIPDFENLEELKMSAEQYMSKKVEETKSLESEIQRLQVEIGNFESQLQSLQRSNDELTSTLNSERTRIVELESSVSTLSAVQSDNQRLESKLQTARDDLKTIEEENLILQKDGAETEKLLSAQISALETDVHALEAKLRESSEKLENEATTRKSLIDEISSWKSKWEDLNTSTMEKIELRDKKISELESTIAEMNDAERMLQEAMEEAITVNTNLESQIIELKQKIQDQLTNANSELVGLAGEKGNGESSTLTLELENLRSDLLIANERLDHHSSQEEKYIRTINDLSESMANIENQISSLQKDFSSAIEEKKRFEVLYNDVKKLLEEREQSWQAKYKELELNAAEQEKVRQTLSEKEVSQAITSNILNILKYLLNQKLLIKSQDFARELREDMKETMAEIVDVEDLLGESEGVVFWKDVLELLRRQFADLNQLKLNENSLRTKLKERESEISELYSSQEKYSGTISKYKEKLHAAMEDKIKLEDKIQAMMVQVEKLNKKRMESIELLNEDIKHEKSENEVLRNELNSKVTGWLIVSCLYL